MKCPICKKPLDEHESGESKYFPFCSERCKLIDLGRWLSGKYQIPVQAPQDEAQPSPPPSRDSR
jgi:endogenous inhibitor of DNA gyrase (YacG/DUF329 family)